MNYELSPSLRKRRGRGDEFGSMPITELDYQSSLDEHRLDYLPIFSNRESTSMNANFFHSRLLASIHG